MSVADQPLPVAPEETPERIMREAAGLLVERGYAATTMKAIAERVGITAGALYWHFPSKEAILYSHLLERIDELVGSVRKEAAKGTPTERLAALARTHVLVGLRQTREGTIDAHHGIVQLARFLGYEQQRTILNRQRRHLRFVKQILSDGIAAREFREVDLAPTAFAILTLCDGASIWYRPGGRLTPEAVADLYADLTLRMVAAPRKR
jgi:AcrR family transcriptional regulator